MKPLFISFLFTLIYVSVLGQNEIKEIPKGTTKIVVTTSHNQTDNFKQVLNFLLDNDFEIEKKDIELFTVRSGFKQLPKTGNYYLNFRCKDGKIEITGKFNSDISIEIYGVKSESNLETIINKGMKGSIYYTSFLEMFKLSKLLGNDQTYQ